MKTINKQTLSEVNNFKVNQLSWAVSEALWTNKNKINEILEKQSISSEVLKNVDEILKWFQTEKQLAEMFKNFNTTPRNNVIELAWRKINTSVPEDNTLELVA